MTMKTEEKKTIRLHLTGGLGNQFFQVAAALALSSSSGIDIEWGLGKPRVNQKGMPQIECYELPNEIRLGNNTRHSFLARKGFGYLLRSGYSPRGIEKNRIYKYLVNLVFSILIFVQNKEYRRIVVGSNIGYSEVQRFKSMYLVGYFQSYKYSENQSVSNLLNNLKARDFSNYKEYVNLANVDRPLVVHVRLADYLNEPSFGILSESYYREAIEYAWNAQSFKSIWLFSDEPEKALNYIPIEFRNEVKVFGDVENCVVKTLEVMRLGHGYVIANSTFSWWGARLSHTNTPLVIAPKPWFKGQEEPNELIPPEWVRINGWPDVC